LSEKAAIELDSKKNTRLIKDVELSLCKERLNNHFRFEKR